MPNLFLGLDGGGTKCRARVITSAGEVVYEGTGGPTNFASTPREQFILSLQNALGDAPQVQAACLCLAGILSEEDKADVLRLISPFIKSEVTDVRPDFHAAVAACPPESDACVIIGTGSLVASMSGSQIVKSGGGGYLLGDDGSAFSLGRAGIRSLFLGSEALTNQALTLALPTGDKSQVISEIYKQPRPVEFIARLAPAVLKDFHADRPYAVNSVQEANEPLWKQVIEHLTRECGERDTYQISVCGGVVENDDVYFIYWLQQLNERLARARKSKGNILGSVLKTPPVEGACRLATLSYEH